MNNKNTYDFNQKSKQLLHQWFSVRSLSKGTQTVYKLYITQFLKHNNTQLDTLYNTAIKEQTQNIPLPLRTLSTQILDYKYHVDNKPYTQSTKYLKIMVIISFCRSFQLELPDIRVKKAVCEPRNYERPITKEEILLMLNTSPLRERAFLSLQATTGMGSKEVRNLTIMDILNTINQECQTHYTNINEILQNHEHILTHPIFQFNIIRKKVNYRYITFTTNDTMQRLLKYIEYRVHNTKPELKLNTQNIDEPIFITNKGTKMKQRTVTAMYRLMGEKVGFKTQENHYRFWRSHNIRKYFYNIVEECVGNEYAEEWLGHVPNTTTQAYARREYRMKNAYKKCLPYLKLTHNTTEKETVDQKIKVLEEEIKRLKLNYM